MNYLSPLLAVTFATLLSLTFTAPAATFTVTNTDDSGSGSLRQAISSAAGNPGADVILFNAALSGRTITLASELSVTGAGGVTISAMANAGGITLSGNNLVRCFSINASGDVTLLGLTITRGRSTGDGAGVRNSGNGVLRLENCTLTGNVATNSGGGLHVANNSRLNLVNCTLAGNSAGSGGALSNANSAATTLSHCTVTGNSGTTSSGGLAVRGTVTVENSIIAGNTGPGTAGPDINLEAGTLTRQGINLIGNNTSITATFPAGLPNANGDFAGSAAALLLPGLSPLANNGGPSFTMMPLPASAARDRIAASSLTGDQRGLPRGMWGKSDIGAVEAGLIWNSGWEIREVTRTPATALNSLADAEALAASVTATSVIAAREVIDFSDPQSPGQPGYFNGDTPFVSDTGVNNDDFVTVARTFIAIPQGPVVTANRVVVTTLNPGGQNNFHLAEIQVFETGSTTNVAAGAAGAVASGASSQGSVPADVNDGNTDGIFSNGSVWHSPGTAPLESITVTFSAAVSVDAFRLWGRTDCCTERDDLLRVEFFNGATLVSSQITGILRGAEQTGTARVQDYTFGFRSDDGARLRLFRTDGGLPPQFRSSTRVNTGNPSNPAHTGNTLSFAGLTSNSDTLGVVPLGAGIYGVEYFYWERAGAANAEVFASTGAKTAVDSDFRLLGDGSSSPRGPGASGPWEVNVIRNGAATMAAAISQLTSYWCDPPVVTGLRFTSAGDNPARDPMTFILEGTNGTAAAGPWSAIATGNTGLTTARQTAGPVVAVANITAWKSYRLIFPTVRDAVQANSMQIGDVEFLNASGRDLTAPGNPVLPSSPGFPASESAAEAIDNDSGTKYVNFDELNTGFTVTPDLAGLNNTSTASTAVLNFTDPQNGGGGHGWPQTGFPGDTAADDNNYAAGARSTITVPEDGFFTFCVLGDDSVRVRIPGSRGWRVSGGAQPVALLDGYRTDGCCADAFGQLFLRAGTYPIEVIYHESTGSSYLGVWAAPGQRSSFDTAFTPVGTASSGSVTGLAHATQPGAVQRSLNDDFAAALTLSGARVSTIGRNTSATLEAGEPVTANLNNSVWWTWTAPASGRVLIDTTGSSFDTILSIHTGAALSALTLVAENDDDIPSTTSLVGFSAVAGTVYRVRAGGYAAASGTIRLNISSLPNDAFSSAVNLGAGASVFAEGSNRAATAEVGEPQHSNNPSGDSASGSLWFTWTPALSGAYTLDTTGSDFDTVLAVYTGTAINGLIRLGSDDQSGQNGASLINLNAAAGVTYRIAVDGFNTASRGRLVLNIAPRLAILAASVRDASASPSSARIFTLRWRSREGDLYRVQSSPDLLTWSPAALCAGSEGSETEIDFEGIPRTATRLYFRVLRD